MKQEEITKIVNKVYPLISKENNSHAKVEYYHNIYERLSGEKGMTGEVQAHAEYDWSTKKIYFISIPVIFSVRFVLIHCRNSI